METKNGNGEHEGGGVAVEFVPCATTDLAAIMDMLEQMPPETVAGIRRTFELYNDGTFDRFMAEHGAKFEGHEDVVEACLPDVERAILLNKIAMLRNYTVEFVAGIDYFLRLAVEGAAG